MGRERENERVLIFLEMLLSVIRAGCWKTGQGAVILIPSGPTHLSSPAPSAPFLPRPLLICRRREEALLSDLGKGKWLQEVLSSKRASGQAARRIATFFLLFGVFFGDLKC